MQLALVSATLQYSLRKSLGFYRQWSRVFGNRVAFFHFISKEKINDRIDQNPMATGTVGPIENYRKPKNNRARNISQHVKNPTSKCKKFCRVLPYRECAIFPLRILKNIHPIATFAVRVSQKPCV